MAVGRLLERNGTRYQSIELLLHEAFPGETVDGDYVRSGGPCGCQATWAVSAHIFVDPAKQ